MKVTPFYQEKLCATHKCMSTKIKNYYEHPPKDGAPKKLVILLHGLGSNGKDLISLAPFWAATVPDALFISPDAPFACDMVPEGYPNAFQWFSLQTREPKGMLEGVRMAAPIVHDFITEQLEKHKIEPKNCVLVGFSQGTMLSLTVGPSYKDALGGILGYSGAIIWDEKRDIEALHKIPVHLIHGEADDVVPVTAWQIAKKQLEANGFSVTGYTQRGLPHSIDNEGIESGARFLNSVLNQ